MNSRQKSWEPWTLLWEYTVTNWGHNIEEWKNNLEYYIKNYESKKMGLKGLQDRLNENGYDLVLEKSGNYKIIKKS